VFLGAAGQFAIPDSVLLSMPPAPSATPVRRLAIHRRRFPFLRGSAARSKKVI